MRFKFGGSLVAALDMERILSRVLPHRSDRIAAKMLLAVATGPILLLFSMWAVHGATAAQLTWAFRARSVWPYTLEGQPLQLQRWYRTSRSELPVDPWGEAYYVEDPYDEDSRVCSAGPNRVFELGEGDDIQVAGFFFFGVAHLLIFLAVCGVLSSVAGTFMYLAWREALMPRSSRVQVELARAAVISLPILVGCLCLVFAVGLDDAVTRTSVAYVPRGVAVVCTTAFVVYMIVLCVRIGRPPST